jgi:poly(3-hydroxyalkanoate) synthetase
MVPPCINKYYILDLQPENSLVRYAVEQGNTVFLISWATRTVAGQHHLGRLRGAGRDRAIRVVQDITGEDKLNMFGFCVGGTIVSTALAVLAARGEQAANSLTLLTTFLDFATPACWTCSSTKPRWPARAAVKRRRPDAGPRPGQHLLQPASERPGVELRSPTT